MFTFLLLLRLTILLGLFLQSLSKHRQNSGPSINVTSCIFPGHLIYNDSTQRPMKSVKWYFQLMKQHMHLNHLEMGSTNNLTFVPWCVGKVFAFCRKLLFIIIIIITIIIAFFQAYCCYALVSFPQLFIYVSSKRWKDKNCSLMVF